MSPTEPTIHAVLSQILTERGQIAPNEIQATDSLTTSLGLDSLDLAVVVVRLEQQLGQDPFRDGRPMVATVGELVALYQPGDEANA